MPLGKDSIQKRVAKPAEAAPAKKAPAKKPAAKKPASAVIPNISPEITEKVTGHKEGTAAQRVALGQDLPYFLL